MTSRQSPKRSSPSRSASARTHDPTERSSRSAARFTWTMTTSSAVNKGQDSGIRRSPTLLPHHSPSPGPRPSPSPRGPPPWRPAALQNRTPTAQTSPPARSSGSTRAIVAQRSLRSRERRGQVSQWSCASYWDGSSTSKRGTARPAREAAGQGHREALTDSHDFEKVAAQLPSNRTGW